MYGADLIPLEIYEPAFRARRPVEIVPAADGRSEQPPEAAVEVVYDEEAEAVLMARLRDLGYIE